MSTLLLSFSSPVGLAVQQPAAAAAFAQEQEGAPEPRPSFDEWLQGVRDEARALGISDATVQRALTDIEPLPIVVQRDASQAEFVLTLDAYLKRRLDAYTVREARRGLAKHRDVLRRVATKYGVPAEILVSVWGLESTFGRFAGVRPTIPTLATLAYEPRRATYFREELFNALRILDRGDIELASMKGSWAGAMGQPQFMPSSYLEYAVDFNGDGRKDIWKTPPDIFGSIANYLSKRGWARGLRWGRAVRIPASAQARVTEIEARRTEGCPAARTGLSVPRALQDWRRTGITLVSGRRIPTSRQPASLLRIDNRVFLVYRNYEALLAYNCAHRYALSVSLLADRLTTR